MDEDLAFCLTCFVHEQVEEDAKQANEIVCELEIEEAKVSNDIDRSETIICERESQIAEKFSNELQENHRKLIESWKSIEAELRTIFDCSLLNINIIAGKVAGKQADDEIRAVSNRLRRQNEQFDSEVTRLIDVIDRNKTGNCSNSVASWFQQHLKYIEDLSETFGKNDCQKLPKDTLIERSADRGQLWMDRRQLIYSFAERLEIEDEAANEYLIDSLNNRTANASDLIKFARSFVQERQEQRRYQKEESLREMKRIIEEKRLEQQMRAIQLAAALRQLAVGSSNANQFDQKFKQVLNQSKATEKFVSIVRGQIDQPKVNELPLTMCLDADFDTWSRNDSAIRERFCATVANALKIPTAAIRIVRVEQGSAIVHALVRPPHGQVVIEKLAGDDLSPGKDIGLIQECCKRFDCRIYSIVLGEFGLNIEKRVMDPRWNKVYTHSYGQSSATFWSGSLDRGGKPYFCPKGWIRYGIKKTESATEFDAKWGSWHIAYHGTRGEIAPLILSSGLRSSVSGCFAIPGKSRVYLTPSIEYAAHPRYACPWQKNDDKKQWYQLVFQCRVNPASVGRAHQETLIKNEYRGKIRIDENFSNDELEWVMHTETAARTYITDNIVCYGLMIRKTNCNPKELPVSKWWSYSHHADRAHDTV